MEDFERTLNLVPNNNILNIISKAKQAPYFTQRRLFNYFVHELIEYSGKLYEPFEDLSDIPPPI